MFFVIFALIVAMVPVYCVLAGFVELARRADRRRSIAEAFAVGSAALTASLGVRPRGNGA